MTSAQEPSPELETLFNEFLDDTISEDGMRKLSAALGQSVSARSFFLRFCQLHLELVTDAEVDKLASGAIDPFCEPEDMISKSPATVIDLATGMPSQHPLLAKALGMPLAFNFRLPAVTFLVGILVAVFCYEIWLKTPRHRDTEVVDRVAPAAADAAESVGSRITPVAYLASTNGCNWGANSPLAQALGSAVNLGDEITLHEGIAEFRLSSGVSMSIEGPAALVITSPASLVLQHGKVTVHVPWAVADFRMLAGSCRINASEAEFGVRVVGDEISIHAFMGQVIAAPAFEGESVDGLAAETPIRHESDLANGSEFSKVSIATGRSVALSNRNNVTKVKQWKSADFTEFSTKLPMAGGLPITSAYANVVLASKPMDYWRFERCVDDIVVNEVAEGAELKVVGDVHFVGDANNRAVELGRPGSDGFLLGNSAIDRSVGPEYSVELWLKPSHIHNGSIVSMAVQLPTEMRQRNALYLQLCGPNQTEPAHQRNRIRFLHRDPPSTSSATGTSCYARDPYLVRRWQHVAAVKDAAQMRVYIDGELVSLQRDETTLASQLDLIVGQAGKFRRTHRFIGQLDELAIYDRALSQDELKFHRRAVEEHRPVRRPSDS